MPRANPVYEATPPPASGRDHRAVVVAGGGLVGLTLALDLARHGVAVTLLDAEDSVATGSRAICFAKRSLEIYGRLGLGGRMLEKGVTWKTGRVFHGDSEAFAFDLLPEAGHEYPAFVNLQQYHVEEWLVQACQAAGVDLRWCHTVTGVAPDAAGATLAVTTPAGDYTLRADWLLACDGARSTVRRAMALPFQGQEFRDRFLIADVVIQGEVAFPAERWFWFDPPFHPGQSVLLHKQPDDLWRIDFQLGWDADPVQEAEPGRVRARVAAMLGPSVPFEVDWISLYTFRCRRLDRFVHGRVIFAGDAAHQVSPFGARGGNGGVQDADNLGWKLAAVLRGQAGPGLLDSYEAERIAAAEENILHSTRATDFITPKSDAARAYRDAVLDLAPGHAFARAMVNSGRLSRPAVLTGSSLNAADDGPWPGGAPPGSPAPDAPVLELSVLDMPVLDMPVLDMSVLDMSAFPAGRPDWLLRHLGGEACLLVFDAVWSPVVEGLRLVFITAEATPGALWDHSGLAAARFGAPPGGAVLIRPDQHIAARFAALREDAVRAAFVRMMGGLKQEMP